VINMRKKYLSVLCILILALNIPCYAAKFKIPIPTTDFYVYDEPNILDKKASEYIIKTNEELYKKTGAQIVVVIVDYLEDVDINQYAVKLFEEWGIGSREYDNGVLMLVAIEQKQIWIEIGYGLEGALPDGKVGNIIENSILPYFREGKYSDGIISGFNDIIDEVEEEYSIELNRNAINEDLYRIDGYGEDYLFDGIRGILIAVAIVIFLIVDIKFFNGFLTYSIFFRGSRFSGYNSRGNRNNRGGGGRSGGGGAGGRW